MHIYTRKYTYLHSLHTQTNTHTQSNIH